MERFCDKISTTFYNNRTNEIGITSDSERAAHISFLVEEHRELARKMTGIATRASRTLTRDEFKLTQMQQLTLFI